MGNAWFSMGEYTRAQAFLNPSVAPSTPTMISAVSFRRDTVSGQAATAFDLEGITVDIGHGVQFVDSVFADNIVGTPQEIFSGDHTVPSVGSDELAFDAWTIPIDPPFAFDPSVGRLMLDVGYPNTDGSFVAFDCNNDSKVFMKMSTEAYDSTTGDPPTTQTNATGCGWAMRLTTVVEE